MNTRFILPGITFCCMVLLCAFGSCKQAAKQLFSITGQQTLDSIPSGSGIVVDNGVAYVVGDDATHIYRIDLKSFHATVIAIAGLDSLSYREPKPIKHDFECATLLHLHRKKYLLATGSGSKAAVRDSAMLLNLSDYTDCRLFSMGMLYDHIRQQASIPAERWNIEGVTVASEQLLLANRGTNDLISIDLNRFITWLQYPTTDVPPYTIHRLTLPAIANKEARLSGLCTKNATEIFFCASVEDTPDWVSDGPILGSFIGSYSVREKAVTSVHLLRDKTGKPMPEKIESIDIIQRNSNGVTELIAIADNDDGSSKIFNVNIRQGTKAAAIANDARKSKVRKGAERQLK